MEHSIQGLGQYRTHDPPKNFRVRIIVRKVVDSGLLPPTPISSPQRTNGDGQEGIEMSRFDRPKDKCYKEDLTIRWQEKFFSKKEYDFYGNQDNCLTSVEETYHNDIVQMRERDRFPNERIFTYLDADSFAFLDEIGSMTLSSTEKPSYLVQKMAEVKLNHYNQRSKQISNIGQRRGNVIVEHPSEAMKQSHVLTTPSRSMQIMLDLNDNDGVYSADNEVIICSIKLDANGQMTMKPDFNHNKPYRIEMPYGGQGIYEYTLEHCSAMPGIEEQLKEEKIYQQLYSRHAEIMSSKIGHELKPMPQENELIVYLFGEIVSAKGFEYDDVYVQYFIDLPQDWSSDCTSSLMGVTQRCKQKDSVAHLCFPFECQLLYTCSDRDEVPFIEWPTIYVEVCSLDSWLRGRTEGYGYTSLPKTVGSHDIDINTWRPLGDGPTSEMKRFFTGGGAELDDTTYVKIPAGTEGKVLSKFYFRTVASGSVQIRFHSLFQYRNSTQKSTKGQALKQLQDKFGVFGPADGLASVLDAFQKARKRLLEARAALPVLK